MARSTLPPFFLVWREEGGAPIRKHETHYQAEQEARRLASENPGQKFCVLAPMARIVTANTIVERFDCSDDIPF